MKKILTVLVLAGFASACASDYTVVDRSAIVVSDNSRVASGNLIPGAGKHPTVVAHLALAQEVYQKQLDLLKERRNKVRARRRGLTMTSFGVMALSALGTGYFSLAAINKSSPTTDLKVIGVTSLLGAGLGTGLQIGALMQEETNAVDDKITHLQQVFDGMLETLRTLATLPESDQSESRMSAAIEAFINQALQINVKG